MSWVITKHGLEEAIFLAWAESRVWLYELALSHSQAYRNDRFLGDGFGLGIGKNGNLEYPFNTTTAKDWLAWNPPPLAARRDDALGVVLQDWLLGVGWVPRWVTRYGPTRFDMPELAGPFIPSHKALLLKYAEEQALNQKGGRKWGTWKSPDGEKDRRRLRWPLRSV